MKFGAKIIKKEDIWLFLYLCKVVTQTMMKRIALFLILFSLAFNAMADRAWTVRTVPNTRLQSNDIHVSDPDGYLSDSVEMTINTALCAIRDKADVFVVTLSSIGEADPKRFATELFNDWGIGDAETDNGVLLLFVEDQHALEFETGYGAEETLTDSKCERIFTKTIKPFFKAGDYEGGLCAGVGEIVSVYGGEIPDGLKATLPSTENFESSDHTFGEALLGLMVLVVFLLFPLLGIIFWAVKTKTKSPFNDKETLSSTEEVGVHYVSELKTSWSGSPWDGRGCLGGLLIGLSFFVFQFIALLAVIAISPNMGMKGQSLWSFLVALLLYLTWICFRHNRRMLKTAKKLAQTSINPKSVYQAANDHTANKVVMWMAPWLGWIFYLILKRRLKNTEEGYLCPTCGQTLNQTKSLMLPGHHATEEHLGTLHFTPYRCVNGHTYVLKGKGPAFNHYLTCEKCGALTAKVTQSQMVRAASYSHSGQEEKTYECQYCHSVYTSIITIPKLEHASSSYSSSSGSSYSSHHSSHHSSHSSGSFGGGHSGGGGYSGKW